MNKNLLIDEVASKIGDRATAVQAVEAVFDSIVRAVTEGERVRVTGFGSLTSVERPARFARNPQTGERVRVKATRAVQFRAGASFKALVDGAKKLPEEGSAIKKAPKTPRS